MMMNLLTKQQKQHHQQNIHTFAITFPPSPLAFSSHLYVLQGPFVNLLFADEMSKQYKYYDLLLCKHIRTDKCESRIAGYSKIYLKTLLEEETVRLNGGGDIYINIYFVYVNKRKQFNYDEMNL